MTTRIPVELQDFRKFLWLTWRHLGLPNPTRLQYDVARTMQHGPDKLVLMCWRGFGKSFITDAYKNWRLLLDQREIVMGLSATESRALDSSRFCYSMVQTMPVMRHLAPREDQRQSAKKWDVNGAPTQPFASMSSYGIGSSAITGQRASIIVPDDVETEKNSMSPLMRERIDMQCRELGGAILKPDSGCKMIYLGTTHVEESLYFELASRGYHLVIYPVEYPQPNEMELYGEWLAPILREDLEKNPDLHGEPVEPERFPRAELEKRLLEYKTRGYALQFKLLPSLADSERYPLKLQDLVVMDLDMQKGPGQVVWTNAVEHSQTKLEPVGFAGDMYFSPARTGEEVEYEDTVIAIDPAGRGDNELAYVVLKWLGGNLFLMDAGGMLGGYSPRNLNRLCKLCKKWGAKTMVVEGNWGDGMFIEVLRPVLIDNEVNVRIEEVQHYTRKEERIIDRLEPVLMQHRLIVNRQVILDDLKLAKTRKKLEDPASYMLFHQLTHITYEKDCLRFDDRVDALAMGVGHFTARMKLSQKRAGAKRREQMLEREMAEFDARLGDPLCTTFGARTSSSGPRWVKV